jgi:flagellin-like hook-associated protein FlgL
MNKKTTLQMEYKSYKYKIERVAKPTEESESVLIKLNRANNEIKQKVETIYSLLDQNAELQKEVERLKWRLSEIVSCTKQSEVDGRNILNDNKSGTFHFAIKEAKEIITTK